MTPQEARRRFADARVARLATAGTDGVPHIVPMTFAVVGEAIYSAVDHKPKRTTALRRLENVRANPFVSVLVDFYGDDWRALWWARADGRARVLEDGDEAGAAVAALAARYPQYRSVVPGGPVLAIEIDRWSGWAAGG